MNLKLCREEAREAGLSEGIAKGEHKKALETARNFLNMNIPPEKVASGTGLSIEEVLSITK